MANFLFEMLIPKRPVSHQAKSRENLQAWKDYVYGRARNSWQGLPISNYNVRVTLVYLCDDSPADIDNIIKPIQDALVGIVLADDALVSDVDSHRRFLRDNIDVTGLPGLLADGVYAGQECVYVRVTPAERLENYL